MGFMQIKIDEFSMNPIINLPKNWMLITAGTQQNGFNTMVASWGHFGAVWGTNHGNPTSVIFIRPERYTKEFVDREALYTLSFFSSEYKKALLYLGTHSGRDEDKVAKVGFKPWFGEGFTAFEEAETILVCRKVYRGSIVREGFIDKDILTQNYAKEGIHDMYIGEIVKVLKRE